MHELGVEIEDKDIMLGTDLATISDEELNKWFNSNTKVKLFARTKPEQKMRIVDILKKNGEVVAMMGDGVNDAPALKKADIGIVVNEASDVAKESANLILLDSSFNTIVDAVEEGRGMFDNIRKIILYLLCDAFVQIIAIIIAMSLGFPIPVTTAQILWINLVSDGFPSLALTLDPKRKGLMSMPPRSPKTPLVSRWIITLIVIVCFSGAAMSFGLYAYVLNQTNDLELARSVAFVCFGITTLMYVYSVRTLKAPIRSESPLNNLRLI
jgi:Ca2+-transporting ATPase